MQFNAKLTTKIGDLHFELIKDIGNFKRKIEWINNDELVNDSKITELIQNAGNLLNSLSYFKNVLTELNISRKQVKDSKYYD